MRERGAVTVRRLLTSGIGATSRLSEVEIASALARRSREGILDASTRDRAVAALEIDFDYLIVVELTPQITNRARSLLLRHALRASDAVQLASCLHLQDQAGHSVPFVAFDGRLRRAARLEGLTVVPVQ